MQIPQPTWRGLIALVDRRIDGDWLAEQFPDPCPDGNGVAGTNRQTLFDTMHALVPNFEWRPSAYETPETHVALDLVDFVAQRVAKPVHGPFHSFYRHYELNFDVADGRAEFRAEVNLLFARGGVAFELEDNMHIVRLGPPESRQVLADLQPDTGDTTLDQLIIEARSRYLSRNPADERIGLEKLWDAFERLKTIEPGKDKKARVVALLERVASGAMQVTLEQEALELTKIGNEMQIRHFETGKAALTDAEMDYLFIRMSTFVFHVLRETDRIVN